MSGQVFPPVRAVVFDMGGVLTVDPFEGMVAYATELGIAPQYIADAVRSSPEFEAIETGNGTIRDFLKWLCAAVEREFGTPVDIRRLAASLETGQVVRPEMVTLVEDLRAAGMRLGLLTNNAREARSWWRSGVLPLEAFELVLDSSALGLRKPDPEIFYTAVVQFDVRAEEVVFVDDLQANVDGALRAGLRGLLFKDPMQCRWELLAMLTRTVTSLDGAGEPIARSTNP